MERTAWSARLVRDPTIHIEAINTIFASTCSCELWRDGVPVWPRGRLHREVVRGGGPGGPGPGQDRGPLHPAVRHGLDQPAHRRGRARQEGRLLHHGWHDGPAV